MKTISEWLSEIGDAEIRAKAINNFQRAHTGHYYPSLASALIAAFDWEESPEGAEYWYTTAVESLLIS